MGTGVVAVTRALLPKGDEIVPHTALRTASIVGDGPSVEQFHLQHRDERGLFLIGNGSWLTSASFFKMPKRMEQVSLNASRREPERCCHLFSGPPFDAS